MDLLNSYDNTSSSDEQTSEEDNKNIENIKLSSCPNNFFGIGGNDDNDESQETSDIEDRVCVVGNERVELPKSEFWNELTDTDLKIAENNTKTCALLSKPASINQGSINYKTDIQRRKNAVKLKCNSTKPYNVVDNVEPSHKMAKMEALLSIKTNKTDQLKKIFYIHSKIKPALHSNWRSYPPKGEEERSICSHKGVVNRVKWNVSNFSHLFLSASMDCNVYVWNAWPSEGPCVRELKHHEKAVKTAQWSLDGRNILSCSYDRTAILSDVETGKLLCKLEHKSYVTSCQFHPVRRSQVVTGSTNTILQWDERIPSSACRSFQHKDDMGQIQDIMFNRHGDQLFTCSDMVTKDSADRNIMAWDYDSGVVLSNQIYQERYACVALRLHPRAGQFLSQTHGGYIAVFSINKPYKMVRSKRFEGHMLHGYSIGFDISPDGSLVHSGSSDGKLRTYDFQTGKLQHLFDTGLSVCMDVSCHPVLSRTVVCCSWNGDIKVFH